MKTTVSILIILISLVSTPVFSQLGVKSGFSIGQYNSPGALLYSGAYLGVTYEFNERLRGEILVEGLFRKDKIAIYSQNGFVIGNYFKEVDVIYNTIPVTIGADYRFFTGKIQPFAGLNIGVLSNGGRISEDSFSSQYFTLQPKIGTNIVLKENLLLDLSIKYHFLGRQRQTSLFNSQFFGASIGINCLF
jgi:outer membrane protein W